MEKVKINGKTYNLVPNGWQLDNDGGRIIFQPADHAFDEVLSDLRTAKDLTLLDGSGNTIASRSDLVYAGRLQRDDNWIIGVDTEENDDLQAVSKDIIGTVMIAEFHLPDVREQLAETNAKIDYVAMMAEVEV